MPVQTGKARGRINSIKLKSMEIIQQIEKRLLVFLRKLFTGLTYEVAVEPGPSDGGVDLVIQRNDKKVFIEVKVTRSKNAPPLSNALLRLVLTTANKGESNALLITTSILSPSIAQAIRMKQGPFVWDRSVLYTLTEDSYELRKELEEILSELKQSPEEDVFDGLFKVTRESLDGIWESTLLTPVGLPPVRKGQDLCKELKLIPSGKADASAFEKKCEEILNYLFDIDLGKLVPQNATDDTLHRFDLIARIASQNDFWKFIARDFRTRFVIFECKNYTAPITQSEVYTTEKYLYTTALRSVAIIIAKKGADNNAVVAMKGALREHGKLILCLSVDDLCKMLYMKDNGDDPNNFLSECVDTILMRLSR